VRTLAILLPPLLPLLLPGILGAPRQPDVEGPTGIFTRLGPPERGDWRTVFPEEGQTFLEYRDSDPTRGTALRTRIYLQPWLIRPADEPDLLAQAARVLTAAFGREVRVLPPHSLPARAWAPDGDRLRVAVLAAALRDGLPDDALFVLGITDRDLELGDLAFAWGWGSFRHRVGVMTTHGLRDTPDAAVRRRRLLGLALHECGHMLSMAHCVFYRCGMNGARTVLEADRRPLLLCPVCRAKLCWNLELDPVERERALARVLAEVGLDEDAAQARNSADATERERAEPANAPRRPE